MVRRGGVRVGLWTGPVAEAVHDVFRDEDAVGSGVAVEDSGVFEGDDGAAVLVVVADRLSVLVLVLAPVAGDGAQQRDAFGLGQGAVVVGGAGDGAVLLFGEQVQPRCEGEGASRCPP